MTCAMPGFMPRVAFHLLCPIRWQNNRSHGESPKCPAVVVQSARGRDARPDAQCGGQRGKALPHHSGAGRAPRGTRLALRRADAAHPLARGILCGGKRLQAAVPGPRCHPRRQGGPLPGGHVLLGRVCPLPLRPRSSRAYVPPPHARRGDAALPHKLRVLRAPPSAGGVPRRVQLHLPACLPARRGRLRGGPSLDDRYARPPRPRARARPARRPPRRARGPLPGQPRHRAAVGPRRRAHVWEPQVPLRAPASRGAARGLRQPR